MDSTLGIALIGCGQIANAHLKAVSQLESATLIATMDVVEARAVAAQSEFNARRSYTNLTAALADPEVDAVVLALPHHLHKPIAIQAANAKKHILVEKPMALNLAEAEAMCEAAEQNDVRLLVGQSTRFVPAVSEAKRRVEAGEIGEVYHCVYHRHFFIERLSTEWRYSDAQCGGLYLPLFGSHDVDAMLWWLNREPTTVYSALQARNTVSEVAESDGVVVMTFSDGALATLSFSTTSREDHYRATLIGSQGTIALSHNTLSVNGEAVTVEARGNQFLAQMREFVEAVQSPSDTLRIASGRSVLRVMAALDAAKTSAQTNTVVRLEPTNAN